jgi:hypothetical protein
MKCVDLGTVAEIAARHRRHRRQTSLPVEQPTRCLLAAGQAEVFHALDLVDRQDPENALTLDFGGGATLARFPDRAAASTSSATRGFKHHSLGARRSLWRRRSAPAAARRSLSGLKRRPTTAAGRSGRVAVVGFAPSGDLD